MNPSTGRLVPTADGTDLVLTRTYRAPIEAVWASITESERTARWFASWTGDARPGATIRYRLVHEEGQPEADMVILACEPPHHLAVRTADEYGAWHLEARLAHRDGTTTLELVQHLDADTDPASVGPGWEWYLDLHDATFHDRATPTFDGYEEHHAPHYRRLTDER